MRLSRCGNDQLSGTIFFFFFFLLFFLQLYCPSGISSMGNSGCFQRGKPAAKESRYPTFGACWVFWCFYNPPNSDMDYRIFNVLTGVSACDCTRGCTDTVRESALKVDFRRKIPCCNGESNLRQQRASPMLYQLSHIPHPIYGRTSFGKQRQAICNCLKRLQSTRSQRPLIHILYHDYHLYL